MRIAMKLSARFARTKRPNLARFYANENLPLPVVDELRRLAHDALTVAETGKANLKTGDSQVLEFAISERRAVLTFNRKHFIRLHGERPAHAGIIACTYDPDFVALAGRIHQAVAGLPTLDGQLIRITRAAR